jgi:hypothetical protein
MNLSVYNRRLLIAASMAIIFSSAGCSVSDPIGAQQDDLSGATIGGLKEGWKEDFMS